MRARSILSKYDREEAISVENFNLNRNKISEDFPSKEELNNLRKRLVSVSWHKLTDTQKEEVKKHLVRNVLKRMANNSSVESCISSLKDCSVNIHSFTANFSDNIDKDKIDASFLQKAEYANNYLNHTKIAALSYVDAEVTFIVKGRKLAHLPFHHITKSDMGPVADDDDLEPDFIEHVKQFSKAEGDKRAERLYEALEGIAFALYTFENVIRDMLDDKTNGIAEATFTVKNSDKSTKDLMVFTCEFNEPSMLSFISNAFLLKKATDTYKLLRGNMNKLLPDVLKID